jgi:hypothetical protein
LLRVKKIKKKRLVSWGGYEPFFCPNPIQIRRRPGNGVAGQNVNV